MNVSIEVCDNDKFVVHYKNVNGFNIIGFDNKEQAIEFLGNVKKSLPRISKLEKYVTLENIIFDYFNEIRGKI